MTLKRFQIPEYDWPNSISLRKAARGIIIDENKMIPLLWVGKYNYHKLPWWWIEWDENPILAFQREVLEECGCIIDNIHEVWTVIQENSTWQQISHLFYAKVIEKAEIHFTEKEISLGFELRWYHIDEVLEVMKNDKIEHELWKITHERDFFVLETILEYVME